MMKMMIGLGSHRAGCTMMIVRTKRRTIWIRLMWTLWMKIWRLPLPSQKLQQMSTIVERATVHPLATRMLNRWIAVEV
jgi:hypothetical protein